MGRHDAVAEQFAAADAIWSPDPEGNGDRLADLERCRAELELARGRVQEARTRIAALLASQGFPERRDSPVLPAMLRTAAKIELSGGSPVAAESYAHSALELAETVARDPAQSADVGEALLMLGLAQRARGAQSSAEQSFARAAESLANGLGAAHPLTLEARSAAG
jgi:hypothetical protein